MNNIVIEANKISKKYGTKTVLNNISFNIQSGECVALLGVNGAGKSTLINILNQLIEPNSGTFEIFGNRKVNREKIGVMLQNNFSISRVKVKEIIELTRSYCKKPLSYKELLTLSKLEGEENNFVSKLSGGQKRRLNFALAMAGNPELIYLDEPTAGMDSSSRQKFWQEIAELKKQGKTFLITSHYLEELENISDRIMILKDTQLVYNGSLQELREQSGKFEVRFSSQLSKYTFTKLSNADEVTQIGNKFNIATENVNALISELTPYFDQIDGLNIEQNSLESLFNKIGEDK